MQNFLHTALIVVGTIWLVMGVLVIPFVAFWNRLDTRKERIIVGTIGFLTFVIPAGIAFFFSSLL